MEFLVICWDADDPGAQERRQLYRTAHLEGAHRMLDEGTIRDGGAIVDEQGAMIGSACFVSMADRAAVEDWIAKDPYTLHRVWSQYDIIPMQMPPLPKR